MPPRASLLFDFTWSSGNDRSLLLRTIPIKSFSLTYREHGCGAFSAFFSYIHPNDTNALPPTCTVYCHIVDEEYACAARNTVLPGGCWHYILCKRARDCMSGSYSNHMPMVLASLVDSRCVGCHRPVLVRVSVWGFAAHPLHSPHDGEHLLHSREARPQLPR